MGWGLGRDSARVRLLRPTPLVSMMASPKDPYRAPRIAWPSLGLFVLCLVGWPLTAWAVVSEQLATSLGVVVCTLFAYLIFTPLHEATHRSLSTISWLNESVGRVCAWAFLGFFGGFRDVHLEHHKHTNHPEHDPDFWVARGPRWALPLRWLTLDLHYHIAHLRRWSALPMSHKVEAWVTGLVMSMMFIGMVVMGWGLPLLWLWVVPLKLAFALLAFSFDFLPHHPHRVLATEDRYRATLARPSRLLSLLLLNQNLHNIHHLYPALPFYRYGQIWRARRAEFLERGVEVRPFP